VTDAVLDSAPDAVITTDENGSVVGANAAAERMFGVARDAIIGRPLAELLLPGQPVGAAPAGEAGTPARIVGRHVQLPTPHADRPVVVADVSVTRTAESPPRFTHWIRELPGEDAREPETERRQALLEAAEEIAEAGSWEWTPAESQLVWSDNLFRIFGLAPGAMVPTPDYVFAQTHPDDRDRVVAQVQALRAQGRLRPLDYRILRPDRSVRHLRATLAVTEERDGEPYRLVGSVQDLTSRLWAEREIAAHVAVAQALAEWESLEPGAERLLAYLAEAMGFVAGVFWVPRGGTLVARVVWQAVDLPEFASLTRSAEIGPGADLPGRVWERREPLNVVGGSSTPRTPRGEVAALQSLRSAVAVPAVVPDGVLAVVELLSREEAGLTERVMRSLTGIGHELGRFLGRRRGELEASLLSPREIEVLQLAAHGLSAPRTAERLFLSPATVKTHFENIYAKLGVSDKPSAVATALRQGLIH
jgi:PAS domain-containing protein/DNA-binding CsgD family transcriptional regulator